MRFLSRPFWPFVSLVVAVALAPGVVATAAATEADRRPADPSAAVVKVYVAAVEPNVFAPWQPGFSVSRTGSGAVIEAGRILTNAHVVSGHTFVQVRPNGSARKVPARVAFVSHIADLALLEVHDAEFPDEVQPLPLGELPAVQAAVAAYGFPHGGDTLSITTGVVARVEHEAYAHSGHRLLSIQMDAAIAPGSSGGPLVEDGRLVGVAMQTLGQGSFGSAVPVPLVRQFLEDVTDGRLDGIPSLGLSIQTLENPALRASLGMPSGETGILINVVPPASAARGVLQPGDVLLGIDGVDVADDATVEFRRRERTSLFHISDLRQIGSCITLRYLRAGEVRQTRIRLSRARGEGELVRRLFDRAADYYVFGGLAFISLSMEYIESPDSAVGLDAFAELLRARALPGEEVVYLADVLSGEINRGYEGMAGRVVRAVDGQPVENLSHLAGLVESGAGEYVTLDLGEGRRITLERAQAVTAGPRLLESYGLTADRSARLLAPLQSTASMTKPGNGVLADDRLSAGREGSRR
jgi:S1-C subfamily serine protease